MASGKTTGTDEISPDLTRHCKAAHCFFCIVPQDFRDAKIITLNKNCNNCKGISFLIIAGQAFAWIILICLQIMIISLRMKNVLRHRWHHRLTSISSNTSPLRDRMEDQPRMTVKKMAVYKACVISTLLYSRQTWITPYRRQDSTLSTSEASSHLGAQIWRDSVRHRSPFPHWPF